MESGIATAQATAEAAGGGQDVPYYVGDYGTIGSGTDNVAINAAIAAASSAGGGVVYGIPNKVYTLANAQALALASNVGLKNLRLDVSGWTTAGSTAITATGSIGTATNLTANANEGATTLTAASWTGFAAGDWIKISSTAVWGSTSQALGEINRVASVSGTTLTLSTPLMDSYTTATTAKAQKITFVDDVSLENIRILGPSNTTLDISGVSLQWCRNASVNGLTCVRTQRQGIALIDVIHSRLNNMFFAENELSGFAYGVTVNWACQDVTISNFSGYRMRHLISFGGGSGSITGVPRDVQVTNAFARQVTDAGFDSHAAGERIHWTNCHVNGSTQDGFAIRTNGSLNSCSATNITRYGLEIEPLQTRAFSLDVRGFKARRCGDIGVAIFATSTWENWAHLDLTGIDVDTTTNEGVKLFNATATRWNGINIEYAARNCGGNPFVLQKVGQFRVVPKDVRTTVASTYCVRIEDGQRGEIIDGVITATGSPTSTRAVALFTADRVRVAGINGDGTEFGVQLDNACTNCEVQNCDMANMATNYSPGTGTGHRFTNNRGGIIQTVASAATITLSGSENDIYLISGTANITAINTRQAGTIVRLMFTGGATGTGLTDNGTTLNLQGNLVYTANDAIELYSDGTNWIELGRSVN